MPLNDIQFTTINDQLAQINRDLNQVELFFAGVPVSAVHIEDASIGSAQIADLSVTNAKFADLAITNAKITSVDAAKFTAGTLNAARIGAGTITASKLDVTVLSAISANVGTITAGNINGTTITGGTVRTSSGTERYEMTASPNAAIIYNGSGSQVLRFDPEALKVNNTGFHWLNAAFSLFYASHFRNLNDIYLQVGQGLHFDIINGTSGGDIQIVSASNQINIWPGGSGTTYVNGSIKTAIVPTKSGYKALYCLESPEVWLFDFAPTEEEIDPLFLETTDGETNILRTDQGEILVFRKRKGFIRTRFESKTLEQFDKNNEFWGRI